MSRIEELDTYRVIEKRDIQEMNSRGWVLEHKKTPLGEAVSGSDR